MDDLAASPVHTGDIRSEQLPVRAYPGAVTVTLPNDVLVVLAPDAAAQTGEALIVAAHAAREG